MSIPPANTTAPAAVAGLRSPSPDRFPFVGLAALFTAAFAAVMTELLPAGLLPRMSAGLGVSESRVGFLVTAYAAASFAAAIPLTSALRGKRRRRVLVGALLGFAAANAVTAASDWYALTFAARLLAGAMGGLMWAMLAGYAARMVSPERRGRAIALVLAGITVAMAVGVPAGTAAAGVLGWRGTFAVLAGLGLAVAGWVRVCVPDFPGEPAADRAPLRETAAMPGIPAILGVTLTLLLGHQAVYTYLSPLAERADISAPGPVLLTFGAATVAGVWAAAALADRGLRAALLTALAAVTAALALVAASAHSPALLFTATALWGLAFGGIPALIQTALVAVSGPRNADVATSLQATVYNAGIATGSLTGGLILAGPGPAALPWTALPLLLTATALVATHPHAFPSRP